MCFNLEPDQHLRLAADEEGGHRKKEAGRNTLACQRHVGGSMLSFSTKVRRDECRQSWVSYVHYDEVLGKNKIQCRAGFGFEFPQISLSGVPERLVL